uniref:Uncharacterized protein n=1 Tax=Plectus sambesii TaxID=2011161 RepID=A0A914V0S8_9BILA
MLRGDQRRIARYVQCLHVLPSTITAILTPINLEAEEWKRRSTRPSRMVNVLLEGVDEKRRGQESRAAFKGWQTRSDSVESSREIGGGVTAGDSNSIRTNEPDGSRIDRSTRQFP